MRITSQFIREVIALPPQTSPDFPTRARSVMRTYLGAGTASVDDCITFAEDRKAAFSARFAALYIAMAWLWRRKDYSEYEANVRRFATEFGREPYFDVFRAQAQQAGGDDLEHWTASLTYAKKAAAVLPDTPGVLHMRAEIVAAICELGGLEDLGPRELIDAIEAANQAVSLCQGSYAKYHATLARLLIARGRFDEARKQIHLAVDGEEPDSPQASARLASYEILRYRVTASQEAKVSETRRLAALKDLERFQSQSVTLIGLLAAVIAFIVSATSITTKADPAFLAGALVLQGGIIMLVFASFSFSFGLAKSWRFLMVALFGVALSALGYLQLVGII